MEHQKSQVAAAELLSAVQPEVQKYLEAVYAVAPVPEEYVKYRLHLATALPLELLDCWFELRRQTPPGFLDGVLTPKVEPQLGGQMSAPGPQMNGRPSGLGFSLFGPPAQPSNGLPKTLPAQSFVQEDRVVSSVLPASTEPQIRDPEPHGGRSLGRQPAVDDASGSGDDIPMHSTRFTEADLEAISSLVGLETLTSTQEHSGSSSLFMFEQLTALDSLDTEGRAGNKRKRTRHQHFWRNTDKLDARERVYIPTTSIKPALRRNEPVVPKAEISPEERTNAWTVCLTTRGVVSYLNKRISPLGVQLIRALQSGARQKHSPQPSRALSSRPALHGMQASGRAVPRKAEQPVAAPTPALDSAWTRVREEPRNQESKPGSSSQTTDSEASGSHGRGQKRKSIVGSDWQPAQVPGLMDHPPTQNGQPLPTEQEKPAELIPRVRRRKPV